MSLMNISATNSLDLHSGVVHDEFYRYKMPVPDLRYESKAGGRTKITNLDEIAAALERPKSEILQFIKYALKVNVDPNANMIMGTHTLGKVRELMLAYISAHVLCRGCGNPETFNSVHTKYYNQKCRACGHCQKVLVNYGNQMDNFIVKNRA
jgi:translation initiation factor 2 beta subunit (eIF-2beta)/eIF-5